MGRLLLRKRFDTLNIHQAYFETYVFYIFVTSKLHFGTQTLNGKGFYADYTMPGNKNKFKINLRMLFMLAMITTFSNLFI